jgi:hypothetical protein
VKIGEFVADVISARTQENVMKKMLMLGLLSFALVGCGGPPPKSSEQKQADQLKAAEEFHIPPGAKKVVALGCEWYTFELEVGGRTRKFLYRVRNPNYNSATETITELRD